MSIRINISENGGEILRGKDTIGLIKRECGKYYFEFVFSGYELSDKELEWVSVVLDGIEGGVTIFNEYIYANGEVS